MKLISRFYAFAITVLVAFLFGFVAYFVTTPTKEIKNVNGVEVQFPIKIDDTFKVINANLDEYEITVILKDMKTGEIYESTLLSDELEELVCNQTIYSAAGSMNKYDCSTETNIIKSMIMEIGEQSVELIKEGY